MFNYSSMTIINSDVTANGKPLFFDKKVKAKEPETFIVKRHFVFQKGNVTDVFLSKYADPEIAQVEFDFTPFAAEKENTIGRIALYMVLQGDINSAYMGPMMNNGKPLYFEFCKQSSDDTAEKIVKRTAKVIKNYMLAIYGEAIIEVEANGPKLIINGVSGYQIFKKAIMEKYNPNAEDATYGKFETFKEGKINKTGYPGFGTYGMLIKDYRLPSPENTRFGAVLSNEYPLVNGKYDQFIIHMCVDRGVMGTDAVGDTVESKTVHVFWVLKEFSDKFKQGIEKALGGSVTEVPIKK